MTIKLDSTQISVVVRCTLCEHWYGFGFDRTGGWAAGAAHEERVHPELVQAREALRMRLEAEAKKAGATPKAKRPRKTKKATRS